MTNISVYDTTATALDKISEENYTSIPEILEALIDAIKDGDINIADYV